MFDLKKSASQLTQYSLTTVLITLVAVVAYSGRAAFVEPLVGAPNSSQDFTQNILGANNANNSFDSTSVTSNNNGSVIERLEYISANLFWIANGADIYRSSGNVGIGTSSPAQLFSVQGSGLFQSAVTAAQFAATNATATSTFGQGIEFSGGGFIYDNGTQLILGHK